MLCRNVAACGILFTAQVTAQFNLYPNIDPTRLSNAFNISSGCLNALNSTVSCDQTLLTMSGTVDDYLWDIANVTALCTSACLSSSQTWYNTVYSSCLNDTLNFSGRLVPPYTVPGRIVDGLNIACLTPSTNISADPGVAASIITITNETSTDNGTSSTSRRMKRQSGSSSSSGYCLIDSYNWVGSDIIRPDCSLASNQNASQCIDPTDVPPDNERLVNLYPNSLICSTCFINMYFLRVASPYLPDLDYSDYLIEQYYDIIETCNNTNMPNLIVRDLPDYQFAPGTYDDLPIAANNVSTTPMTNNNTANGTCPYQSITIDQYAALPNSTTGNGCDPISQAYNVSSGDLYAAFNDYDCAVADFDNTTAYCLPKGCTVYPAPANITCDQVVGNVSTAKNNITVQQLLSYNPNFQGTCDQLIPQYLCLTPPGGAYIPPPVNSSATNANQQQRGGGDSSSTGNQTVVGTGNPAVTVSTGGAAPSPTQSGIIQGCRVYSNASAGDTCYGFAQEHNITSDNLYAWNSVLGAAGGQCSTQFWSGYWYCIGTNQTSPTPSSTPTPVTSGQAAPSPTQSGIVSNCDKYAKANTGDTCTSFSTNQGIGVAQLYTWNTQLGANGQNCSTQFWAGYYYCVHAPTAVTSTAGSTGTAAAVPSPTQSGIVSNCNKYFKANTGDTCSSFAQENAITTNNLYTWNTQLGTSGQNCSTQFWAGYYYCIGVSSSKRWLVSEADWDVADVFAHRRAEHTEMDPTLTTESESAPSPTQSGIVSNCNKYFETKAGDTCTSFAVENGITPSNLYKWNTQLGAKGQKCDTEFFAGYYYCTGVKSSKTRGLAFWAGGH